MTISTLRQRKATEASRGRRQSGFSLVEVAIGVGVLGAAMATGYALLKSGGNDQHESNRSKLLAAADHAIISFIAQNGRLPCPDTDGSGNENCSAGNQKGWLPAKTLGLDASAPTRGLLRLRYVAYRTSTVDLANLAARFYPSKWDNYSTPQSGNYFFAPTLASAALDFLFNRVPTTPTLVPTALDFCQGLTLAQAAPNSANSAYMLNSGATINIAYGLAEGGTDRDGDGNIFDGPLNFVSYMPGLESPGRAASGTYDDMVLTHSFSGLSSRFSCPQSTRSIDGMAQALEVVNQTNDLKTSNYDSSIIATGMDAVKAAITLGGLAYSIYSGVNAGAAITATLSATAVNVVLCVDPFTAVVGCPLLATSAAATALAATADTLAVGAIAANVAVLALQTAATVEAGIIAGKLGSATNTAAPSSRADILTTLNNAHTAAVIKAAADLLQAQKDQIASDASAAAYLNSSNQLYALGDNDATTALHNYVAYKASMDIASAATGNAKNMRSNANATATAAITAANAATVAAAISPASASHIINATQTALNNANAADTTAKANLASDQANAVKIQASVDSSVAVLGAQIDAFNATNDPTHYVVKKQIDASKKLSDSLDLANQASALEVLAASATTNMNNLSTAYNNARSAVYSKNFGNGFELDIVTKAYDDKNSKKTIATTSQATSDSSASSVISSLAAYNSLLNAPASGTGTALVITITSGADSILGAALLKGNIK